MHLVLIKKWFDAHLELNGKNEEYRALTPYWFKRLMLCDGEDISTKEWKRRIKNVDIERILEMYMLGEIHFKEIDEITYSNGMKPLNILPRFERKVSDIFIGTGKEEWGAEKGKYYFVIEHSTDAYNLKNC